MRKLWRVLVMLGFVMAGTAHAAATPPDTLVKNTVDEVMGVIKQNKDKRTLHDLAEKKVLPHFDFTRMTQLAVGKYWRQASDAQKKSLETGFKSLLVTTYTAALTQSSSNNQTVEVRPLELKPNETEVTVRTLVKEAGRQPISIDYRMALQSGGWKVYDVVVENLSLVTNYRGSFGSEINRSGIDGLIKVIDDKNRKLAES